MPRRRATSRQTLRYSEAPAPAPSAVFACSTSNDFFEAIQLDVPIEHHWLFIGSVPHLYPLMRLNDQFPRYAVLVADTNSARLFVFGQNQYLKDEFKDIEYLLAPTGGLGYKLIDPPETKLGVDGSAGVVWEKNTDLDVATSGALAVGQKLQQQLTENTILTQAFAGLWKTDDFEDALFTLGVSIAASMSS